MSLANKFTLLRIILAPAFFVIYLLPVLFPKSFINGAGWTVPIFWLIIVFAELTDMFDGMAARKRSEVSDFGKFFDPFADTLLQVTVFLCLVVEGIYPAFLFLIVLYREFGILLIRNMMLKKGITMGARMSGKVKTVSYISAGAVALITGSFQRLDFIKSLESYNLLVSIFKTLSLIVFIISVIISVISFIDYFLVYQKTDKAS